MIKVFETFAGIGSQTKALKNIGVDHKVVAISEWDINSLVVYDRVHNKNKPVTVPTLADGSVDYNKIVEYLKTFTFSADTKKPIVNIAKLPKHKLLDLYKANVRSNNVGSIVDLRLEDIPEHDLLTYSFPCFPAGYLVMTKKGYKKIENIHKGDEVLTHTKTFKKVVVPMKKATDDFCEITCAASEPLVVTPEHPFYVSSFNGGKLTTPVWKDAKDITTEDLVGVAINQENIVPDFSSQSLELHKLANTHPNDFWYLLGLYFSYGSIYVKDGKKNLILSINDLQEELNKVENTLSSLNISYKKSKKECVEYQIDNTALAEYFYSFGSELKNKTFSSDLFNLPVNLLKQFLLGYGFDYCASFTENNVDFAYGLSTCLAKVYKAPATIQKICVTVNKLEYIYWQLCCDINNQSKNGASYDSGYIWYPVLTNRHIKLPKKIAVYNFEVEEDNSYTVNNIVVHNCQAISLQGKRGGLTKGTGTSSSLLWEIEKILNYLADNNKLPKFLLMENVAALFNDKFKPGFDLWKEYLSSLGYETKDMLLTASNFDIPQNRTRSFAISVLKDKSLFDSIVVTPGELTKKTIADILESNVDNKYYLPALTSKISQKESRRKKSGIHSTMLENYTTFHSENVLYYVDGIAPTITASGAQSRIKIWAEKQQSIRLLTPKEHWKLMGFTETDFNQAKVGDFPISEVLLKKMAGNSIVVKVLEGIFKEMFK